MAYVVIPNVVAGQVLNDAWFNQLIDNLEDLNTRTTITNLSASSVVISQDGTTLTSLPVGKGEIVSGNGTTVTIVPAGTTGQILQANASGAVEWAAPPAPAVGVTLAFSIAL